MFDPAESGDDLLYGGDGVDQIVGMLGADTIVGGAGNDFLIGGLFGPDGESDIFVFDPASGLDSIFDFENNFDQIDLSAFGLASIAFVTTDDADADGNIEVIIVGVDPAVFSIELVGFNPADLDASDFILS